MFLLRLDDASEYWNASRWNRMHGLLKQYGVRPLVAVIPKNEDPKLRAFGKDDKFWETFQNWMKQDGWSPALHGFNHVLDMKTGGVNPINHCSEFAGRPLSEQQEKIRAGLSMLRRRNVFPQVFVAPAHTFDLNTLEALRRECNIRIISDTIAFDIYFKDGFHYIPQQSGMVRNLRFSLVTFCYHPNTMTENEFKNLENFLKLHVMEFVGFEELKLKNRTISMWEKVYRFAYFTRRRFI